MKNFANLEMKGINIDAAIHVKASLEVSQCQLPSSGQYRSFHQLRHGPSEYETPNATFAVRTQLIPITQLNEDHVEGYCESNSVASLLHQFALITVMLLVSVCTVNIINQ